MLLTLQATAKDLANTNLKVSTPDKNISENWDCKDPNDRWNTVIVSARADKSTGKGKIEVAGTSHNTTFEVAGFDRLWQFGELSADEKQKHGTKLQYKYAFRIKPNGTAHYFNLFSNLFGNDNLPASNKDGSIESTMVESAIVESEMVLSCHQRGSGWNQSIQQDENLQQDNTDSLQNQLPCLPGFFTIRLD
jgi:hypothetical protein